MNRNCGLTDDAGTFYIDQPGDETIDFRPHSIRDFVTVFRRRRGQQSRRRRDEPVGGARDLHRRDDLRGASIDQLESIADLTKRIDARGGGQHREGADPDKRKQEPPADSELPSLRSCNMGAFSVESGHVTAAPRYFERIPFRVT